MIVEKRPVTKEFLDGLFVDYRNSASIPSLAEAPTLAKAPTVSSPSIHLGFSPILDQAWTELAEQVGYRVY